MTTAPWNSLVVVLVGLLLNAVVAYVVIRRVTDTASVGQATETTSFVDDEGTVECPECGAENELGYRFCRQCVGKLPGSGGITQNGPSTPRGMIR